MIHIVEDDAQYCSSFSPSYRGFRHMSTNTGKRARSPEDYESAGARPSKRLSLAIGNFNRQLSSHSSANSSRQGSEDWVHAAGGLRIDSPYTSADASNPFIAHHTEGGSGGVEDVDMVMESEQSQEAIDRPLLEPLHTSFNTNHQEQYHPHQASVESSIISQHHTPHRHPYGTRYSEKVHGTPPHINVVPATPVNHLLLSQQPQYYDSGHVERLDYNLIPSAPSLPSFSPVPMALSPPNSHAQFASPTKRRPLFGPRANCEKCRAGVPGHFIHYEG